MRFLENKINKKCLFAYLTKRNLVFLIVAYTVGDQRPVDNRLNIGPGFSIKINLKHFTARPNKIKILLSVKPKFYRVSVKDLVIENIEGASPIYFSDELVNKSGIRYRYNAKNPKYNYLPLNSIFTRGWSFGLRRSGKGSLILNKRSMEEYESSVRYYLLENKCISFILYLCGSLARRVSKTKVNIYFEKYAGKSEEGVLQLCQMTQNSKGSRNYFVIDGSSADYEEIKREKFVIKKYSIFYYWLCYRANYIIASEAPLHLNILRSNNKYLRKSIYNMKNIFLQHGIIYMKNLSTSSFANGKEAEADVILVSSEKEKSVVKEMLNYDDEQIWVTGIPMYDTIKYNHIGEASEDNIMIMLTWKPYEENLVDFAQSSYYKNTMDIYNCLLKYYDENKIKIVAHPKVFELMNNTKLNNNLIKGKISEVLPKTKLLITDYSSICYNAFYQGAGVIFYQNDLEEYEKLVGPLIPHEDEYIGERFFDVNEFEKFLMETNIINAGKISLKKFRNEGYNKRYNEINEYSDGNNVGRIHTILCDVQII